MAVGKSSLLKASNGLNERKVVAKSVTESGYATLIDINEFAKTTAKADEKLIKSIKEYGVIVPCVAVKSGDKLKVIDGAKRIDALKTLNVKSVPTVIANFNGEELKKELNKFAVKTNKSENACNIHEEKFKLIEGNGIHTVLPIYLL